MHHFTLGKCQEARKWETGDLQSHAKGRKQNLHRHAMQGQAWGTVFTLLGIYSAVGVGVWMYDKPHKKPYVSRSFSNGIYLKSS